MSGGGGGGAAPVAPTYTDPVNGMTFTDSQAYDPNTFQGAALSAGGIPNNSVSGSAALNAEIASREAADKVAAQTARDAATSQNTTNEATFQKQLADAITGATTGANQYFTDNGYDPNMFSTQLTNAINTAKGGISDPFANWNPLTGTAGSATSGGSATSANPSAAFDPNLGASILQSVTAGDQSKARNALDSIFSPTYAADNITNDWLNGAVDNSLSSQFDPLSSQLTNALKRGTLNQQGYDAATQALTKAQTAAHSTVSNLGSNILANDRTGLDAYITGARNDAASVNPNTYGSFDPNTYAKGAGNLVNTDKNNFAGDLTNAIGSTSFADLPTLLNAGGAVQGATDPTATNPNGAPGGAGGDGNVSDAYIAQQALAKQQRGLGSQGAF